MAPPAKDTRCAVITVRINDLYDHMLESQSENVKDVLKSALQAEIAELVALVDRPLEPATNVAISEEVASFSRDPMSLNSPFRASDQATPSARPSPSQPKIFANPTTPSPVWKAGDAPTERGDEQDINALTSDSGRNDNEARGLILLDGKWVHPDPRLRDQGRLSQRLPPQSPPQPSTQPPPPPSLPAGAFDSSGAPTSMIDLRDVCPCSLIGHNCPNPEECGLLSVCVYWKKLKYHSQHDCRYQKPHVTGTCREWREGRSCSHGSRCHHGQDAPGEDVRWRKMEEEARHHAQMANLMNRRKQEQQAHWGERKRGRSVAGSAESGNLGGEIEEGEVGRKEHVAKKERRS